MSHNERTPLKGALQTTRYDPVKYADIEGDVKSKSGSTAVRFEVDSSNEVKSGWRPSLSTGLYGLAGILLIAGGFELWRYESSGGILPPTVPQPIDEHPRHVSQGGSWSSEADPYSTADPESLGFMSVHRRDSSMPGPIFGALIDKDVPLPTNSWCESLFLGETNTGPNNKVFQVPYILDTDTHGGTRQGVDTHPAHVQANTNMVMVSV
jgi:hypothetical protein